MSWVIVRNWDKFQTYAADNPRWIKLWTSLTSDDDWLALGTAARGMLTTIWVEYARTRGQLRVATVMHLCGKSARSSHLEALSDAGFIAIVPSKPSRARAREEKEKSKEKTPQTPQRGANSRKPKITGWRLVKGSHGMTHVPDPEGTDRL